MKNKSKKQKKASPKKEIKRPAHKKPRAKKYVEAKIPDLPPVPTNTIPVTKEVPEEITTPKAVIVELPEGQTEKSLADLVYSAADRLKEFIEKEKTDRAEKLQKEQDDFRRLCGTRFYKDPGVGLIHRHNYENEDTRRYKYVQNENGAWSVEKITDSKYVKMLEEEKAASREENDRVYANIQAEYKRRAALHKQKKTGWFQRLFSWFK